LHTIATDVDYPAELRHKAVEQLGKIGTHEALLVLLDLVANERLDRREREDALKQAREILKTGQG